MELVPDLNATTLLRSFKQFVARGGIPAKVLSDNARTFKSAAKTIQSVLGDRVVEKHFSKLHIENLEKAPWWGGIFERLMKSTKRCLKKVVARACLTYDELQTILTEVEAVLNSRLLSYISTDDRAEPLTPSHLSLGYRVSLSLPDPTLDIEEDPEHGGTGEELNRRM